MFGDMSGWHLILVGIFAIAGLALFVVALVSIITSKSLSDVARAVWVLIALLFPVLGPIVWFFARPRTTE